MHNAFFMFSSSILILFFYVGMSIYLYVQSLFHRLIAFSALRPGVLRLVQCLISSFIPNIYSMPSYPMRVPCLFHACSMFVLYCMFSGYFMFSYSMLNFFFMLNAYSVLSFWMPYWIFPCSMLILCLCCIWHESPCMNYD